MNVQQLIDQLSKVKDKTKTVIATSEDGLLDKTDYVSGIEETKEVLIIKQGITKILLKLSKLAAKRLPKGALNMKNLTKEQMINILIDDMENWDVNVLCQLATDLRRENLENASIEELQEIMINSSLDEEV